MNSGIVKIWQNFISGFSASRVRKPKPDKTLRFAPVSQIILDANTIDFMHSLKVKDITDFHMHHVKTNESISDCLDKFLHPFKTSVLVVDDKDFEVMGVLNLKDVITHLNISLDLKSMSCPDFSVSFIMDTNFVPLEYDLPVSKIFVDLLNCECPIHPVYNRKKLSGALHKETILDILKVQMLEEALMVKQMPPYDG